MDVMLKDCAFFYALALWKCIAVFTLQELVVANVALENGVHEAGWVAVHFASEEAAAIAQNRYKLNLLVMYCIPYSGGTKDMSLPGTILCRIVSDIAT